MRPLINISIFILFLKHTESWKAIESETRRIYQYVAETAPPSQVQRIHLEVTKDITKNTPEPDESLYIVDLRWAPPHRWNGVNEEGRYYSLNCQYQQKDTNESTSLLEIEIPWDVSRLREKFPLPEGQLVVICAMRATNDIKKNGKWAYSEPVNIHSYVHSKHTFENSTTAAEVKIESKLMIFDEKSESSKKVSTEAMKMNNNLEANSTKEMSLGELLKAIHESTLTEDPFDEDDFAIVKQHPVFVTAKSNEDSKPFGEREKGQIVREDLRPNKHRMRIQSNELVKCELDCSTTDSPGENIKETADFEVGKNTDAEAVNKEEDEMQAHNETAREVHESTRISIFDTESSPGESQFDVIEPSRTPDDKVIVPDYENVAETTVSIDVEPALDLLENKVTLIEDLDEKTKEKIKEDYDAVESQLKEALGVDGVEPQRLNIMSSLGFGIHDRLL